jgi:hypothetical protein
MNVDALRFIDCYRFTNLSSTNYFESGRTYGFEFCITDLDSDTAFALRVWVVAKLLSEVSC